MITMLVLLLILYLNADKMAVMNAKGIVAWEERQLLVYAMWMMLIIVVPVFFLMLAFIWRYRAGNAKAKYLPDWAHNTAAEVIWWGLPCLIVIALSAMVWISCQRLDPYRPLEGGKGVPVQVIALQYKWLFLYPEQGIATLNYLKIPENTPIDFEITADAPMNSFWVPQLGGQIFAMPGMRTELHLIAEEPGRFYGSSANLSGVGFAAMHFEVEATSRDEFDRWAAQVKQAGRQLTQEAYDTLALPSEEPVSEYALATEGLFDRIVMAPMMPPPAEK
jgi:cytochrome o ubiquinol oxidase subunit II